MTETKPCQICEYNPSFEIVAEDMQYAIDLLRKAGEKSAQILHSKRLSGRYASTERKIQELRKDFEKEFCAKNCEWCERNRCV